jgi:hypothetical protein
MPAHRSRPTDRSCAPSAHFGHLGQISVDLLGSPQLAQSRVKFPITGHKVLLALNGHVN